MERLDLLRPFLWQSSGPSTTATLHKLSEANPSTGKCFFAFGFETGAVSSGFLSGKIDHPVISHVCVPETGDLFYLLHQQGQSNVTTLAVL